MHFYYRSDSEYFLGKSAWHTACQACDRRAPSCKITLCISSDGELLQNRDSPVWGQGCDT